mmetsp:Transcript_24882/g.37965  ORF Transcript_24882/g.37965 Transcript_24882/m.37965 type:complete len:308 (+) Transcript_24882:34-957(+)
MAAGYDVINKAIFPTLRTLQDERLRTVLLEVVDQSICRTVVRGNLGVSGQFGKDSLGKLLSKFNTPLIERVDGPYGSLHEDFHFVNGNQRSQNAGSQLLEQERVGWSVSFKDLVSCQSLDLVRGHSGSDQFSLDGLSVLSESQRFGLGEIVGKKDGVVVNGCTNVLGQVIVGIDGSQEIARDELGSLVDELVEGMLSVGSGFSPDDGTSFALDLLVGAVDVLSIGLHITLLEVSGEAVHVLVVRENSNGLGIEKVIVPQADHSEGQRDIFLRWRVDEVLVDGVGTGVHFHPVVETDGEGNRSSDSTP